MGITVQIPLEDDLRVFARAWLAYKAAPVQRNLAVAVLAERVLFERARRYKKRDKVAWLAARIAQVKSNPTIALGLAESQSGRDAVAVRYPAYVVAGLLGNV